MVEDKMSKIVTNQIIKMIITEKKYKPKQKMPSQREFCNMLGVSRQVIREAFKTLESKGYIVTKHGSGSYVTENPGVLKDPLGILNLETYDEIELLTYWYHARRSIECEVIKLAVENATEYDLKNIKTGYDTFVKKKFISKNEALFADRNFHLEIAKASHNIILEKCTIHLLQSFYYSVINNTKYQISETLLDVADEHHKNILNFLMARDSDGAYMAMRSHMNHALKILKTEMSNI